MHGRMRYDRLTKCWSKRIRRGIHTVLKAKDPIAIARTTTNKENGNRETLGFETKLWQAADRLSLRALASRS